MFYSSKRILFELSGRTWKQKRYIYVLNSCICKYYAGEDFAFCISLNSKLFVSQNGEISSFVLFSVFHCLVHVIVILNLKLETVNVEALICIGDKF